MEISKADIKGLQLVGAGSFGRVFEATWTDDDGVEWDVAVKILKNHNKKALAWGEIDRMKNLCHDNVLELIGYVETNQCPWIVMEFMEEGSLLSVLQREHNVTFEAMIKYAYGVASGMTYLHKKLNFHGDLAARNCLVGAEYSIKIADFGRLWDEYADHYHDVGMGDSRGFPVRWMPPENIPKGGHGAKYSKEGDVWAYGVLLYEIWTKGTRHPYPSLTNSEVLSALANGENPLMHNQDVKVRFWVREIMEKCFKRKRNARPFMNQVKRMISDGAGSDLDD